MTETVSGIFIDLADPKPEQLKIDDIAWAISRQSRYAGHTMSKIPYTVAQHTVMVSRYVEEALTPGTAMTQVFRDYLVTKLHETFVKNSDSNKFSSAIDELDSSLQDAYRRRNYAFHALMHDFAEAYLVDLPTPVKRLPGVYEAYKAAELRFDALIYETFGLSYSETRYPSQWEFGKIVVGWADAYALLIEAYHFMPSRGLNWGIPVAPPTLDAIYTFRWPVENVQAYHELLARFDELKPPPLQE